jgi:uncharacterized repeat protein (TIGR01451 family)
MSNYLKYLRGTALLYLLVSGVSLFAQSASLSVFVEATPNPIGPNQDITYTINVGNEGPAASDNVQLVFTAPPTTAFQSFLTPAGWSCNPPSAGTTNTVITCTIAAFGPAGDVFTAVMRVDANEPNGSVLDGNGTVTQTTSDPDTDDNSHTASVTVLSRADLGVDKTGPATVIAGETFDYTISVQNNGPDAALDATMTDTLDANLAFVSITEPAGWTCGESLGVVTCTNPSVPASELATFTLTVTVAQISGGTITNDVSISTSSTDNFLPNNQDSLPSDVITRADLSVTKTGPATVLPGDDIAYTIDVANDGLSDAQSVSLTDSVTLPFVSLASPGGWTCATPAVNTSGLVECTIPTLAAGATASFTLTVHVDASTPLGTTVSNTAQITSSITDPDLSDNSATAPANITSAATLTVTKAITAGQPTAGTNVTYDVVITNNGPSAQFDNPGDEMIDQLPAGLTLISASATSGMAAADIPNNRVTWNGAIPDGGMVTVTIIARLDVVSATNQATVNYDADGNGSNESSATSNAAGFALSPATLAVTKTIAAGQPTVGTNVTYEVVITNNGPSTQPDNPGDEMDDQLPPGLTLISASATSGAAVADIPNNHVTWNGSIPNGGTVTVTIVARLDSARAENQATVHFDADGNGTNESGATSAPAAFAVMIPALTPWMLAALAAMLLVVAVRKLV